MRRAEILPKAIRRFRVTTDSRKTKASPNLINRDFTSEHPNDLWLSDITYIPTREGWLYLAAVLDAYSRALVGWAMSRTLDTKLAMDALTMTTEDAIQISYRTRVVELRKQHRMPVASEFGEFAQAGALMSFGPSILDQFRHDASYVDKLFKGVNPGDLPVEQATRLELVVSLETAKALGLTVPPSVLSRADQVI